MRTLFAISSDKLRSFFVEFTRSHEFRANTSLSIVDKYLLHPIMMQSVLWVSPRWMRILAYIMRALQVRSSLCRQTCFCGLCMLPVLPGYLARFCTMPDEERPCHKSNSKLGCSVQQCRSSSHSLCYQEGMHPKFRIQSGS